MLDADPYALLRLGLSVESMIMAVILLITSVPRVREISPSPERRLRMITIVFALVGMTLLLGLTAIYDWDRPAPTDTFLAITGVAIRAFAAFVLTVLVVTRNALEPGTITVSERKMAEYLGGQSELEIFRAWLETHGIELDDDVE